MMYKYNILCLSIVLMGIYYCPAMTSVDEQSFDNKRNISMIIDNTHDNVKLSDKRDGNYVDYIRLPDGECHNCSTYKCTHNKANLGGSEWCIMLFSDALSHCGSDPNCGGYTMTTAEWFHTKYDKNGESAVHLTKAGQKSIACPLSEWSSYNKQNTISDTPTVYGKSAFGKKNEDTCDKPHNFNYIFVSNSNTVASGVPYLCKNHPQIIDNKDINCILPIVDAVTLCNSDDQCEGFMINTDENWQKKFLKNGMQAVQLFGQGVTYTPSQTWRTFKKQH